MIKTKPISLYIHIPYCKEKCPYCDFYSGREARIGIGKKEYFSLLTKELELHLNQNPELQGRELHTLFFGGGTPGFCEPELYKPLIEKIHNHFNLPRNSEWTLELNPGSIDESHIPEFLQLGINRFSVGTQSFNPRLLKKLGRVHNVQDTKHILAKLRKLVGGDSVSLDLMFAVESQTLEEWQSDLEQAIEQQTGHVSLYGLTFHENTSFYDLRAAGRMQETDEDLQAEMYQLAREKMIAAGLLHYEISNFAKPGLECRHNLAYWQHRDYLALGASGHSCINGLRFSNIADAIQYAQSIIAGTLPKQIEDAPSQRSQAGESVMLGLRLINGFSIAEFEQRHQIDFQKFYKPELEKLIAEKLLILKNGNLLFSEKGLLLADTIMSEFF